MKKLLLLGTLAAVAVSAYADYKDYYKVYYNGKEIENEAIIYCSNGETIFGEVNYSADLNFVSVDTETVMEANVRANENSAGYNADTWGVPQVCYTDGNSEAVCLLNPPYIAMLPDSSNKKFEWQLHVNMAAEGAEPIYIFTTKAAEGDLEDYEVIGDSAFTVTIIFSQNSDAKVAGIDKEDETPVYYNLLGKRVDNPTNGVYIVKQGKKVTKRVFGN